MDKAVVETRNAAADSWIIAKVKSGIHADDVSKGFDVSVAIWDGVVVLSGTLANEAAIDRVVEIARRVKGVRSVDVSALSVASI
ncbi:MAG: BON domain-containing protein [Nevskia sp.]|nr:BON domain-containing protein [Nevskia sp.]